MKTKFILSTVFLFFIFSSLKIQAQITLNFEIKNMVNDSCMVAYYLGDKQYVFGDDGKNEMVFIDPNGKGIITRNDFKTGIMILVFPPDNDYVEFVFEGKDLNFRLDRKDIHNSIEVNSLSNILLQKQNKISTELSQKYEALIMKKENDSTLNIEPDLQNISDEFMSFQNKMFADYPDNLFVLMQKATQDIEIPKNIMGNEKIYVYYKNHFFDNINFKDDWLIRTTFFYPKVLYYLDNLTYQNTEKINESLNIIIDQTDEESEIFQFLVVNLLNKYANNTTYDFTDVWKHLVEKYYISGKATWVSEEQLKKITDNYNKLN